MWCMTIFCIESVLCFPFLFSHPQGLFNTNTHSLIDIFFSESFGDVVFLLVLICLLKTAFPNIDQASLKVGVFLHLDSESLS